jgi:hypothetical protein
MCSSSGLVTGLAREFTGVKGNDDESKKQAPLGIENEITAAKS